MKFHLKWCEIIWFEMDWFETFLFHGKNFIETSALLDFGGVSYHIDGVIEAASNTVKINKKRTIVCRKSIVLLRVKKGNHGEVQQTAIRRILS